MRNESSTQEEKAISQTKRGILLVLLIGCSFLVFNIGGYNNFVPSNLPAALIPKSNR